MEEIPCLLFKSTGLFGAVSLFLGAYSVVMTMIDLTSPTVLYEEDLRRNIPENDIYSRKYKNIPLKRQHNEQNKQRVGHD